jgi:serine/threonine protein phosphatase PrpC
MSTETSETQTGFKLSLLRCAAGTDMGLRREENQDAFTVIKRENLQAFFVADGMGGARGGATASRMAVGMLDDYFNSALEERTSVHNIIETVKKVNHKIFEKGSSEPGYAGMGTTLVGLVFTQSQAIVVNVGDSRAYRVRHQNIDQLSRDHTLLSELEETGNISKQELKDQAVSHLLTRSLGPVDKVDVECKVLSDTPENGDIYLLCSDGLYNYVPQHEILAVVRQNALDDASQILINLANQRGGGDNITVLIIAVGDKTPRLRKTTMPFPPSDLAAEREETVHSDELPEDSASVTQREIPQNYPKPPPVEEPKRSFKRERRLFTPKANSETSLPRILLATGILSLTLITGLLLGDILKRFSLWGGDIYSDVRSRASKTLTDYSDEALARISQSSPLSSITSSNGAKIDSAQVENPLTILAKQISAQGGSDNQNTDYLAGESEVSRKPEQIRAGINKITQQIRALEEGINLKTSASQMVEAARIEFARLQREYSALEASMDVASRAVTLWLSRQVALENHSKALDYSIAEIEQVAAYSAIVKEKLIKLSTLSLMYRGKADEIELYPNKSALRTDLEVLQTQIEEIRKELNDDVRRALGSILANAYREYEAIKIKRDTLWLELQNGKMELDVALAMASNDPTKRSQLLARLKERLVVERQRLGR